jgi:hypothetical protein
MPAAKHAPAVPRSVEEAFAELADIVTVAEAEAALKGHATAWTIKRAIRAGRLKAFIPGGLEPGKGGAGQGYRIKLADLRAWFFGS